MPTTNAFADFLNNDASQPTPSPWLQDTDNQFLNHKSALHWARHDYWRLWEAMLLILGLSPEYYTRRDSHFNEKLSPPTLNAGLGGLLQQTELDIALERYCALPSSGKLGDWLHLYEILQRSDQFTNEKVSPTEFLAWAKLKHFEVDKFIDEAIEAMCGSLPIWGYEGIWSHDDAGVPRFSYDGPKWLRGVAPLNKAEDENEPEAPVETTVTSLADVQDLKPKERDSLLKLIIGMAVEQYGYVPESSRTHATANIETDLRTVGVPLDNGTIRKWLREGAELLPKA
ncbi:hypothetical protein [Hyphococcus sp.]|uniref:hypothetical protein n=1 Tax=Hyphococcus sp. TaxID=2038636 RepID=UPI003CCBAFFB